MKNIGFPSFGWYSKAPRSKVRTSADLMHDTIALAEAAEDAGMDGAWHPLMRLGLAMDLSGTTVLLDVWWTLLVGAQHYYETRRPGHPNGDVYWVISREAWEIERLDAMPPPDDLTIDEREAVP